jgi:hypothetical protein
LTGNRGLFKKSVVASPSYSRDAKTKAITLPDGHATIGRRGLQRLNVRGFHFNAGKKHHFGTFVKKFFVGKISFLKACRMAGQC